MSIKQGNEFLKQGLYNEAIEEYKKIQLHDPLYKLAQINIRLAEMRRKVSVDSRPSPSLSDARPSVLATAQQPVEQPLVSVVMPVFNVAPYLDASIMSVLNQSYTNIELIIVNDASTDNSINIIRMYEDQDDRIKVINLEFNTLGGAGIPSNVGIDAALGEYLAFADSDDILDKLAIEKMVETALAQSAEIVIANFVLFNDDTRYEETAYDKQKWEELPIGQAFNPVDVPGVFDVSPVPWRKLYKQSFLDRHNIRYPEGDYFYEDNPLHWMVLSQASSVVMLDYVVALHRMERVGQTMGSDNYKMSAMFCHMNTVKNYFTQQNNVPPVIWKQLVNKAANYDWVIRKENNIRVSNILKKRNAQLLKTVLKASGQTAEQIGKSRFDIAKKIKDYNSAREDIDLTIIIPIYECEDLIDQTLKSLLGIKGISYEVLMMDDGSTDKSFEICQAYADKHKNFLLFSQKNKGAGVARNALIPLATGKYTYFLDSDDAVNVNALVDSIKFGIQGEHDLVLFKYRIHFFDRNEYKKLFNSDKKIWDKMLSASSNEELQVLASELINYPWICVIRTDLLHDENIFFGKTVVHNDIPYHWHSIIAAKNIGLFDGFVCDHRKFDTRNQITNIVDARRMMVFEAHRYTQHQIENYKNFNSILPVWNAFITHILTWAATRIPSELATQYENKKVIALNQLKRMVNIANGAALENKALQVGLYRIIGNSIPGLHNEAQANTNLAHIIKNESTPEGFHKHYVLNRIVNPKERELLIEYLRSNKVSYHEIPFDIEEFKQCNYDFASLPDSYFWFRKTGKWVNIVRNTAVRNFKNAYLMNNNGARNFALLHGKAQYDWTMPWDGNCFLSDASFKILKDTFTTNKEAKYILTPMERVTDQHIDKTSIITNAVEEPQISFRQDSLEIFSEERVYGNQPKVELFKRLGFRGEWDEKTNLYPWRRLQFTKSPDFGSVAESSGVFRLSAGNTLAATNGENRSHARGNGIADFIDSIEAVYVEQNYKGASHRDEIAKIISDNVSIKMLEGKYNDILIKEVKDINDINSKERALLLTYSDAKDLVNTQKIDRVRTKSLEVKANVDLKNPDVLLAVISNTLSLIIVSLHKGDYKKSVECKLNLAMLYYFYFDNRDDIEFTPNNEMYFDIFTKVINVIFLRIFEYDLFLNIRELGIKL